MTSVANDMGEVRAARLADRQALAELSGRVHAAEDAYKRSLGLPAPTNSPGISPVDAHPVLAAAAPAIGPPGGRIGGGAGRIVPGHHRAAPR